MNIFNFFLYLYHEIISFNYLCLALQRHHYQNPYSVEAIDQYLDRRVNENNFQRRN